MMARIHESHDVVFLVAEFSDARHQGTELSEAALTTCAAAR